MPDRITFDPSKPIEVFFRVNRAGTAKRFVFKYANGNPYNISALDFEFFVKKNEQSTDKDISLTVANGGLSVSGASSNQLNVILSVTDSAVKPRLYYGELYERTQLLTWFNCDVHAHQGKFDGITETESITISLDGEDINITVQTGDITLDDLGTTLQTASADTPLDADTFNFYDAVATVLRKITWANIKATLKTYFDTLYRAISNSENVLTSGATVDIDAYNNTLATALSAITFTVSVTGDFWIMTVTLSATSSTFTFPANSLCIIDGTASGDNTMALSGTSGDVYEIMGKKRGATYTVIGKNCGQ